MDNAKKYKKDLGDDFLSVEHIMLAFCSDKRFGEQLFKNLQLSEKDLKDTVLAVRGNQRVTDQSTVTLVFYLTMTSAYLLHVDKSFGYLHILVIFKFL